MINAKIQVQLADNAGLLIEFSDGLGNYKDEPQFFTAVRDHTDLLKRLYFKNRMYVCDTLHSFLNQRRHALQGNTDAIATLQNIINQGRNYTYPALCELVANISSAIKSIAPGEKSRFHNHYQNTILPILIECEKVHSGKAKVHYC